MNPNEIIKLLKQARAYDASGRYVEADRIMSRIAQTPPVRPPQDTQQLNEYAWNIAQGIAKLESIINSGGVIDVLKNFKTLMLQKLEALKTAVSTDVKQAVDPLIAINTQNPYSPKPNPLANKPAVPAPAPAATPAAGTQPAPVTTGSVKGNRFAQIIPKSNYHPLTVKVVMENYEKHLEAIYKAADLFYTDPGLGKTNQWPAVSQQIIDMETAVKQMGANPPPDYTAADAWVPDGTNPVTTATPQTAAVPAANTAPSPTMLNAKHTPAAGTPGAASTTPAGQTATAVTPAHPYQAPPTSTYHVNTYQNPGQLHDETGLIQNNYTQTENTALEGDQREKALESQPVQKALADYKAYVEKMVANPNLAKDPQAITLWIVRHAKAANQSQQFVQYLSEVAPTWIAQAISGTTPESASNIANSTTNLTSGATPSNNQAAQFTVNPSAGTANGAQSDNVGGADYNNPFAPNYPGHRADPFAPQPGWPQQPTTQPQPQPNNPNHFSYPDQAANAIREFQKNVNTLPGRQRRFRYR